MLITDDPNKEKEILLYRMLLFLGLFLFGFVLLIVIMLIQ